PATPSTPASTGAATASSTGRSAWPWSPASPWTPTAATTLPGGSPRIVRYARSDSRSCTTAPARSTVTSSPPPPPSRWPLAILRRFNGRLEHLRGSALGFRNLTNSIARSLLETGGFRPQLHPGLRRAPYPCMPGLRRGSGERGGALRTSTAPRLHLPASSKLPDPHHSLVSYPEWPK